VKSVVTRSRSISKSKKNEIAFFKTRYYLEKVLGITDTADKLSFVKTNKKVIQIRAREEADMIDKSEGPKVFFDKVGKAVFNILDGQKKALASILLDRWMLFQACNDSIYVYHVASERANTLYQIVLGGGKQWDGIYEFSLKGKEVSIKVEKRDNRSVLIVCSNDNYDVAMFDDNDGSKRSITRMDFDTDEEFKEALLGTKLISEEDFDIYYKPDDIIKPYINRVLPRIEFQ